ncbi:hypothetical protein ET989_10815 [Propioniciclava sinopodophylli]|uniref:Uncharacterized protein n=1 Tax=Propioniciclava sinopodophylli TaxID=1837344 RepID=A0A4Q9KCF5_9ACTN|nr:hypothetical protein [Propioniciclava sinopodophylli]TBT83797.1 hypothetical protein ET989_10815 [Propioniciclava sinopodophylli]
MTEHHARTRTRTGGATRDTTSAAAGARQTTEQPQTRPTGRNPRAADQGPQRAGRPVTVGRYRGRTAPNSTQDAAGVRRIGADAPARTDVRGGGRAPQAAQGTERTAPRPTVRNTGPAHQPQPLTLDARIRLALGHADSAPARTGDKWPTHRAHRARRRGRNGKTR